MKISKAQQRVVTLMEEGWELGWSSSIGGRIWLQKNGVGRGGETERVLPATAMALIKAGIIVCDKPSFPTSKYRLTNTSKS